MGYYPFSLLVSGCVWVHIALCAPQRSQLPDFVLGRWLPEGQSTTILGPMTTQSYLSFTAANFPDEGEYWFSLLPGQLFRGNHRHLQYCFVYQRFRYATEQSPFEVNKITDDEVEFCWRSSVERMPTHKSDCHSCDCARISILPAGTGKLRFIFEMSPPAFHVNAIFYRTEGPPPRSHYKYMLSPWGCEYLNRSGHLEYPRNTNGNRRLEDVTIASQFRGGCAFAAVPDSLHRRLQFRTRDYEPHATVCQQLNGVQFEADSKIADVRFSYTVPNAPCYPCVVNYSVSASLERDTYVAVGFKGMSWNRRDLPIRRDYFGMQTVNEPIVVGYASDSGGCVREQYVEGYMSHPLDATSENARLLSAAVESSNGRVTVNFTKEEWWGTDPGDVAYGASNSRIMWAIGKVNVDGSCKELLYYHKHTRGVSPLNWFGMNKDCKPLEYSGQTGSGVVGGDAVGGDVGFTRVTANYASRYRVIVPFIVVMVFGIFA
eukprot:TRINITY_DN47260_c0_g1_i1.p1 TRINITY_DN47260_c0_g1~~TRINITY_DN47260_c0_g1_i1.p1  ORF type:complete len:488 (-),score=32.70 TRINITY_DN47260_c0_g1_i1:200-1663(-)